LNVTPLSMINVPMEGNAALPPMLSVLPLAPLI